MVHGTFPLREVMTLKFQEVGCVGRSGACGLDQWSDTSTQERNNLGNPYTMKLRGGPNTCSRLSFHLHKQ